MGGVFPPGYPVAEVTKVERAATATFAKVEARPTAHLDRAREVLLVWFRPPACPPGRREPAGQAARRAEPSRRTRGTHGARPMRADSMTRRFLYWASVAAGLVFAIVPLPGWLDTARPDLALLAIIYWILTSPRIAGLGYAWLAGLILDALRGHGARAARVRVPGGGLSAHKLQLRIRMFPLLHQAGAVAAPARPLPLHHLLDRRAHRARLHGVDRWLPILSGALIWPLIVAAGDTMSRRSR